MASVNSNFGESDIGAIIARLTAEIQASIDEYDRNGPTVVTLRSANWDEVPLDERRAPWGRETQIKRSRPVMPTYKALRRRAGRILKAQMAKRKGKEREEEGQPASPRDSGSTTSVNTDDDDSTTPHVPACWEELADQEEQPRQYIVTGYPDWYRQAMMEFARVIQQMYEYYSENLLKEVPFLVQGPPRELRYLLENHEGLLPPSHEVIFMISREELRDSEIDQFFPSETFIDQYPLSTAAHPFMLAQVQDSRARNFVVPGTPAAKDYHDMWPAGTTIATLILLPYYPEEVQRAYCQGRSPGYDEFAWGKNRMHTAWIRRNYKWVLLKSIIVRTDQTLEECTGFGGTRKPHNVGEAKTICYAAEVTSAAAVALVAAILIAKRENQRREEALKATAVAARLAANVPPDGSLRKRSEALVDIHRRIEREVQPKVLTKAAIATIIMKGVNEMSDVYDTYLAWAEERIVNRDDTVNRLADETERPWWINVVHAYKRTLPFRLAGWFARRLGVKAEKMVLVMIAVTLVGGWMVRRRMISAAVWQKLLSLRFTKAMIAVMVVLAGKPFLWALKKPSPLMKPRIGYAHVKGQTELCPEQWTDLKTGRHDPHTLLTNTICLGLGDPKKIGPGNEIIEFSSTGCNKEGQAGAQLIGVAFRPVYVLRTCVCNAHNALCNRHALERPEVTSDFAAARAYFDMFRPGGEHDVTAAYLDELEKQQKGWLSKWSVTKQLAILKSMREERVQHGKVKLMVKYELYHNVAKKARGIQAYINLATQEDNAKEITALQKTLVRAQAEEPVFEYNGLRYIATSASMMNADGLGKWMERTMEGALGRVSYWFEVDGKNWDATMGPEHQDLKEYSYGPIDDETRLKLRSDVKVEGAYAERKNLWDRSVLRYKVEFTTKSGHNDTSLGNTNIRIGLSLQTMATVGVAGYVISNGDDTLMGIVDPKYEEGLISLETRQEQLLTAEKANGIVPEGRCFKSWKDVTFISGRWYPTKDGLIFGPLIGRILSRGAWTVRKQSARMIKNWRHGVASGIAPVGLRIPILNEWCRNLDPQLSYLVEKGSTEALAKHVAKGLEMLEKEEPWKAWQYRIDHPVTERRVDDVALRFVLQLYDLTENEVEDLQLVLLAMQGKSCMYKHQTAERIMSHDFSDIGERRVCL